MAVEQAVSEGYKAVELVVASGIGGAVVGVIMNFWVGKKLQAQKHEHERQLESLRSELAEKTTVHKLQFEKEFSLYQELWKTIVDVERHARITPVFDIMSEGESPLEVYKKRWMKMRDVLRQAIDVLYCNLPFYHHDISRVADALLTQYKGHMDDIQRNLQNGEIETETYQKDDCMFVEIISSKKDIEVAIRERIGLLQKAEIVE